MLNEERANELKEAMKEKLGYWWEELNFNFVIEDLVSDGIIDEADLEDGDIFDSIYEVLYETLQEMFKIRFR